ncbi:uncharacterized protein N7443_000083 [Penicillium atrosanguineum]|uniref:uncharacterized protein n=1 Tax=Penicillium atrosanguineum TaxID=1132637 RepID=UPI0023A2ACAE|nr:uncharacterized protein N7443_000083 [Penicillium atrosanguineum]KAJ5313199.1 hypothetical protein N7443_000083 [Penicillium atrosanguineum]
MTQPGKPAAGVLQIPAAATQKAGAPAKKAPKPPTPRLKLLIRRLPPGLTQAELETTLGQDWKVGGGKVDWLQYKPGKVSKDPAKPSRPSRAYIHVTSNEHIALLSDLVRQTSFQDARNTTHDPVLLGPPSLEFSPYAKTPGSRVRKDARQGTIDQDPDFIAFLESLTQPLTKPALVDSADHDDKKETVMTTPLVQYIKDKKASKAKDGSSSKSSKRADKESKQEKVQAKKLLQRPDKEAAANSSDRKTKGDKPSKESSKSAKQAAAATKTGKQSASNASKEASTSATERKKERGNATTATKILQRDLGLSPSPSPSGGRRRGKGGSTETGSPKTEASRDSSVIAAEGKKETTSKPPKGTPTTSNSSKAKGPESKTSDAAVSTTSNTLSTKPPKAAKNKPAPPSRPTLGSTQAFLKHANPSQGVTEALLTAAFTPFGALAKVEMDKKKGFGYLDFVESESLQKAMAASPVAVAQSQVVVLERKANPGGEKARKARGDSQQPQDGKDGKAKTGESNVAGCGTGTSTGTSGSSRGSRGGRGGRKGKGEGEKGEGPKGAGAGAGASETTSSEAK